ncbi:hypothetical protein [Oceanihabitans sediminis]|uniref:hypothetical protein n=1 Tax=Oceanihabitans sediminis TaxID=1812012 RepID=UPI000931658F|nr:hypothetical protein [Oceanihabitans sediminis]MDX1277253.1 hypothetical protein [Oceanihabitans sediminis]
MRLLFFGLIFFFSFTLHAQIDNEQKSIAIPVVESDEGEIEQEVEEEGKPIDNQGFVIPKEDNINGMSVPKQQQKLELPKEEFSMFNQENFGDPGELYKDRIKKHASYTEMRKEQQYRGSTTTQFFGDFTTKSDHIDIAYRDHGAFDGDHIRVFVNDDVVKPTVLLTPSYTGFKFKLAEGINKIDFYALDTGQVAPNTAEFQIIDDFGNIISGNQWNLAKGVKATIIIIKE